MVVFTRFDLDFILQQIMIAEADAAGVSLFDLIPNPEFAFGLRTVDGTFNNLRTGQDEFGAADTTFPRLTDPVFRDAELGTSYEQTTGVVIDSQPRIISNLIADQTADNPAAAAVAEQTPGSELITATRTDGTTFQTFFIPNQSPDGGLSAPFNPWFTFFGQFFDHGLDLVTKGGNDVVFIPLQPDDPLFVPGSPTNFMVLTRATMLPGPDGIVGTADDIHENENTTTPFVDQNQTYTSHPSHQVFLRAYQLLHVDPDGIPNNGNEFDSPFATGKLITNKDLGDDHAFGGTGANADVEIGGMATWGVVKAQARDLLGIHLTDADVFNVPLLATDAYGNFIAGAHGLPQVVVDVAETINGVTTHSQHLLEGVLDGIGLDLQDPPVPADVVQQAGATYVVTVLRTDHQFLIDIAHDADPSAAPGLVRFEDGDPTNGPPPAGSYDGDLLDAHYIAGDGRVNENIGLTAVHSIFHSEHNRLVDHTKEMVLASNDLAFLNQWLMPEAQVASLPTTQAEIDALVWNGERLFQAARFGTEMQYQHLVFEEFARTLQPNIDEFLDFNDTIDPAIVAEFAHAVFRLGHSMLTETIDRLDANFNSSEIGLIQAFLNPLEFAGSGLTPEQATGAIVRGLTRQVGNEIDEFVTEAVRNNLLGLPLDLPALNLARGRDTGLPSLNGARREFYDGSGDTNLKPYTSWADFAQNLKHPESLINFIAAYGTHATITSATTLDSKRAAATLIVLGGAGEPDDRLDFLYSTGEWANNGPHVKDVDGVTTTGLGTVDFWIGGLAERIMPFGGMLGSTFGFVFETQLEALQNGDRLYYLHRTQGIPFLAELENNLFSKLVMANSDATHLPAHIFSTPTWILEVDPTNQFTGLGADSREDPTFANGNPGITIDGVEVTPLVIRNNPNTVGPDTNYLQYTGGDHIVLGGTAGDDIMIAGDGDDTLWGDAGNDTLEGGYGNDEIEGGAGDDIITDMGGSNVIHGGDGNDVIIMGANDAGGENLILGGAGKDFIVQRDDIMEVFAGDGDDFILGNRIDLQLAGGQGDDWIEVGTQDGGPGDLFPANLPLPLQAEIVIGNDIFLGDGGFDEMIGEAGDDIFVGSEGPDKHLGGAGFDWSTFKDDPFGVVIDMTIRAKEQSVLTQSNAGVHTRFAQVEGLSGSHSSDVLIGTDDSAAVIEAVVAGEGGGSTLTNFDLIGGLRAFVGAAAAGPDGILGTADDQFSAGNIILGGGGSDIIEGGGGDDLIDGDKWLNVRISVRANVDGTGAEIASFNSMVPLIPLMLNGTYNPGQLVAVREILTDAPGFDTAVFSGNRSDYSVFIDDNNTPLDFSDDVVTVVDNVVNRDGIDRLTNVERLQFNDQSIVLVEGLNAEPVGALRILDSNGVPLPPVTAPTEGQVLKVSIADVTDADNESATNPDGAITGRISYIWQAETVAGSGIFEDILTFVDGGAASSRASGTTFTVTAAQVGLQIRAKAVYQDGHGVLETVFSDATTAAVAGAPVAPPAPLPLETFVSSPGVHFIRSDLQFILDQIKIAERDAAGESMIDMLPDLRAPLGLRTVDGTFNNLRDEQTQFGAADTTFPRLLDPAFITAESGTSYQQTSGLVIDSQPRTISNLIVDMTANNPAAVAAAAANPGSEIVTGQRTNGSVFETFFIPNQSPDEGLSAPFNAWMTFFGQFFDHGLDLVTKGGNGTIFIPLQPDDPLFVPGSPTNFMVLTRATMLPGPDGILGTADDIHEQENTTTPFVDQNQTYTSHPSHQVFLRAYEIGADGQPHATGKLITNRDLGDDGIFGTDDDVEIGGMATWAVVKAQARDILGINLTDADVFNVPLLATDAYGNFIPGGNGFPQLIVGLGPDGLFGTEDDVMIEGNPAAPIDPTAVGAFRTGHQFLIDINHDADPSAAPGLVRFEDGDPTNGPPPAGTYDGDLLDAHYIAGDGRVNENIGLTAVHAIFHSEHNRLVDQTKQVIVASNDVNFINEWLLTPIAALPTTPEQFAALDWDGERLFQAARFGTEMQYQHLVFEEFARTIQPNIDFFIPRNQNYHIDIDPSIVAEFAHTVYRFGHSMLTETIDRLDPNFASSEIGLIQAFLNPLEFAASGPTPEQATGAIVRGVTRQVGNEIDEFVTEALRNNLLGLPLDLPAINLTRGRDVGIPSLNAARREFYEASGDTNLKPYASWAEFVQHLKHPESLVNFIAAYGTHETVVNATTLDAKRAAATLIVLGGAGEPADRLDFLNGTGSWASTGARAKDRDGVTTTGLGSIDFWVGGLAEEIMPFGGMLGSTFNFVFENQLEKLQDGDRFYYLERTNGLNFQTELENNSFARLIMANSDATHLPNIVFKTPTWILEVDQTKQHTGLGVSGNEDPTTDGPFGTLIPLVIRDNPNTLGPDTNYLQYTGEDHIVLGGTAGNDILVSGDGDDTIYGDAGNDRIEGGYGNDFIVGGAGDDIITDKGGDDTIHGEDGNDVIHGGNGLNLIIGGFGNDFIISGSDGNEVFGGPGNDFILGTPADEQLMGNEGDDWIEIGTADTAPGDNFDVFARDQVQGNDIFIGNGGPDRFFGEGGDDIMMGNGGAGDRYVGFSGYDWAIFRDDPFGVSVDLGLADVEMAPPLPELAATVARFRQMEGLSGSHFSDILRGDDADATVIRGAGALGSVLTNIALIDGLQELLDTGYRGALGGPVLPDGVTASGTTVTSFAAGNIILGGGGSDIIEGGGGDDLIDGDSWLNVRVSVRANVDGTGPEIDSFGSIAELAPLMLAGVYNPGQLVAVREILTDAPDPLHPGHSFDTVGFVGPLSDYTITVDNNGTPLNFSDDIVTVVDNVVGRDGTDRLAHIERLQFSDATVVLVPGLNAEPVGSLTLLDDTTLTPVTTPVLGQTLRASIDDVTDGDNIGPGNPTGAITQRVSFVWQVELNPGSGVFEDIGVAVGGGLGTATGATFTVTATEVGLQIRAKAIYQDAHGVLEQVFSEAATPVGGAPINAAPLGALLISDTTPTEGQILSAINAFSDADGLPAIFNYQWQQANAAGVGGGASGFTNIPGLAATLANFTPTQAQVNRELRVVVTYVDLAGNTETLTSAATTVVGDFIAANGASQTLTGTEGQDSILGGGGADLILAFGGNDVIDGGTGADTIDGGDGNDTIRGGPGADIINAGAGNDLILHTIGDGADVVVGGTGLDTLEITGTTGNETLTVTYNGVVLTNFQGGSLSDVETVTADLLDGTDTLSYAGTAAAVTVNLGSGAASGFISIADIENVTGGNGNDLLIGSVGANALNGGAGNDTLVGGLGNDTLTGGTGIDTASYDGETAAMFINLATGSARRGSAAAPVEDILVTIENVAGGSSGDSITGSIAANLLDGGAGDDTLDGGSGNDTLLGGLGNDSLIGGIGNDSMLGGDGNDILVGGAGNDTVLGGAGADLFVYTIGDGIDTYDGGADEDTLNILGTAGANTLTVTWNGSSLTAFSGGTLAGIEHVTADLGGGTDTLSYAGSASPATVNLAAGSASGFGSIAGIENVIGGNGNDVLTGGAGGNILSGGAGNDTLDGGIGNDTMVGGTGDDTFFVDSTGDVVTEGAGGGTDTVFSSATFTLGGNVENLTLTGLGNINGTGQGLANFIVGNDGNNMLSGAGGNDTLDGGAGNDTLDGGAGNDRLIAGNGSDVMTGGVGNDVFVFGPGFGNDVITDFDANPAGGQDLLDVSAFGITAANFSGHVSITTGQLDGVGALDTLVTINGDPNLTITLLNVTGIAANSITQQDFLLL